MGRDHLRLDGTGTGREMFTCFLDGMGTGREDGSFLLMWTGWESNMAPIFQTGWDGTITFYSGTGNNGKNAIVDGKDNGKANGLVFFRMPRLKVVPQRNRPSAPDVAGFVGSYILHHMAADDLAVWEQPRREQLFRLTMH